jgi:hypothetical protein
MRKSKVCNRFFAMGQGAGSSVEARRFQAMGQLDQSCTAPHLAEQLHALLLHVVPHGERLVELVQKLLAVPVQVERESITLKPGYHISGLSLKPGAVKLRFGSTAFNLYSPTSFCSMAASLNSSISSAIPTRMLFRDFPPTPGLPSPSVPPTSSDDAAA